MPLALNEKRSASANVIAFVLIKRSFPILPLNAMIERLS